jgi:serine/threonine protein kinase
MATYLRLGSHLLANELSSDPFGTIHRGIALEGKGDTWSFAGHRLVRTFAGPIQDAGPEARLDEAPGISALLAGARGFGTGYTLSTLCPIQAACDYLPGRGLAHVLDRIRATATPFTVDHALTVLQGLAQALATLHAKGLSHGGLSPHSVWVGFEGDINLLDAPHAAALRAVATHLPALAPYRARAGATPLQADLFALGAILFETLTLAPLPTTEGLPAALAAPTLAAAHEDMPIPADLRAFLERLLLDLRPFASVEEFNGALETLLFDADYNPSVFNLAFFMHTTLKDEIEADARDMKADLAANFAPFMAAPSSASALAPEPPPPAQGKRPIILVAGLVAAAALAALVGLTLSGARQNKDLLRKLATLQQEKDANDQKLKDVAAQELAQKELQAQLTQQATEAATPEERAKAKRDLLEAKAKTEALAKQREAIQREARHLAATGQTLTTPTSAPSAALATPQPQAAPIAQPSAAPQPPAPAPSPQASPARAEAPAVDVIELPPTLIGRVQPTVPRLGNKAFLPAALRSGDIKVALQVYVDAQGHPVKVKITRGVDGPFGYNDASNTAALASKYAPALRDGKPVAAWLNVEYNYGRAQ